MTARVVPASLEDPTTAPGRRAAADRLAPSQILRVKIEWAYPLLRQASERLWCHPEVRRLYPAYLVTMHGVVRSAAPLLEAALERARALAPSDDVAAGMVPYLARHAVEERGHDRWILEDLEATGTDPDAAVDQTPSPPVAALVGAQYYWLRHVHPVSLIGHMAVVEGHAPQANFAARLQRATGYPAEAFGTIRRHAQLDQHHARDLYALIDRLPLEPRHQSLIGVSALHTVRAGAEVFDAIPRSRPPDAARGADSGQPPSAGCATGQGGSASWSPTSQHTNRHRPTKGARK